MVENQALDYEFLCGPEINESSDESHCGPEICEPVTEEKSEHPDVESEIETDTNPYNATFIVGTQEPRKFSLNRFVCQISSPELQRILLEHPKKSHCHVIHDVLPEYFEILIDYMFLKSSWKFIDFPTAFSLVNIAGKFQLFAFQEEIFAQLRNITELEFPADECIFQAFATFKNFDLRHGSLAEDTRQYIVKNAATLLHRDEFLELSPVDFGDILASDDLVVKSELQVFKAVIRWGIHRIKTQESSLTSEILMEIIAPLVDYIRFGNLSEMEFRRYVLPLNILPPTILNLRNGNENRCDKPRRYLVNDPLNLMFKTELEIVRAEQFLSTFQYEMNIHNGQLKINKLQAELKLNQKHYERTLERLEKDLQIKESKVRHSNQELSSLNLKAKALEKNAKELQAELFKIKEEPKLLIMPLNDKILRTLRFENTRSTANAFIVENSTQTTLKLKEIYFCTYAISIVNLLKGDQVEYKKIPELISPRDTEAFGITDGTSCAGFFSYQIYDLLFLVKTFVHYEENSFVMAVCPQNVPGGNQMYSKLYNKSDADWSHQKDRILVRKETTDFTKELTANIRLGKLKACAVMKPGKKAILNVKIEEEE